MADIRNHPDFAIVEGVWLREYADGYVHVTVLADEHGLLDRPYLLHAEHRLHVVLKCPVEISIGATQGRDPSSGVFQSAGSRLLYRREV